jgi:hypothetical protein
MKEDKVLVAGSDRLEQGLCLGRNPLHLAVTADLW